MATRDTVRFASRDSEEFELIAKIAERAAHIVHKGNRYKFGETKLHHQMNIAACHASGNPLRLQALLDADDFNFMHDVFGIDRHIDRDTGKMMNFFSPRFSARVEA